MSSPIYSFCKVRMKGGYKDLPLLYYYSRSVIKCSVYIIK